MQDFCNKISKPHLQCYSIYFMQLCPYFSRKFPIQRNYCFCCRLLMTVSTFEYYGNTRGQLSWITITLPKKLRRTPTEARRHWDKHRNKTRMNINMVFPKWRELCENLELDRDSALACVLIER